MKEYWSRYDVAWFEYHCFESGESVHAEWWYHSHQQALVLGIADGWDRFEGMTAQERGENGMPWGYTVLFKDGFVADVYEDELVTSPEYFTRKQAVVR